MFTTRQVVGDKSAIKGSPSAPDAQACEIYDRLTVTGTFPSPAMLRDRKLQQQQGAAR